MASVKNDTEDSDDKTPGLLHNRRTAISLVIVIILASAGIIAAFGLPALNVCVTSGTQSFSIIMTHQGFNGSVGIYPKPWPVMNVHRCDIITIHVENTDSTGEPHGFAITHYLERGFTLAAGQSKNVTFTVNQAGKFLVYCYIFCTIHLYMLDGQLNVA